MKGFKKTTNSKPKNNTNETAKPTREQVINQAIKFHSQGNISEAAKYYQYCLNDLVGLHLVNNFSQFRKVNY